MSPCSPSRHCSARVLSVALHPRTAPSHLASERPRTAQSPAGPVRLHSAPAIPRLRQDETAQCERFRDRILGAGWAYTRLNPSKQARSQYSAGPRAGLNWKGLYSASTRTQHIADWGVLNEVSRTGAYSAGPRAQGGEDACRFGSCHARVLINPYLILASLISHRSSLIRSSLI